MSKITGKIVIITLMISSIVLIAILIFLNKNTAKQSSVNLKPKGSPTKKVNVKAAPEFIKDLQRAYVIAKDSSQGTVKTVKSDRQEVVLERSLDGKISSDTILATSDALIYERSITATTNPKVLTFQDLTKGQYISVSGTRRNNILEASVITIEPILHNDIYQPMPTLTP